MAATIKTAISIRKSVLERAEILAHELNLSRSGLFELAVEDFIRQYESRRILRELNATYGDQPDPAEDERLTKSRKSHRRLVDGEW
jgi:hypothetical protein